VIQGLHLLPESRYVPLAQRPDRQCCRSTGRPANDRRVAERLAGNSKRNCVVPLQRWRPLTTTQLSTWTSTPAITSRQTAATVLAPKLAHAIDNSIHPTHRHFNLQVLATHISPQQTRPDLQHLQVFHPIPTRPPSACIPNSVSGFANSTSVEQEPAVHWHWKGPVELQEASPGHRFVEEPDRRLLVPF
jgi:hypothetical protein